MNYYYHVLIFKYFQILVLISEGLHTRLYWRVIKISLHTVPLCFLDSTDSLDNAEILSPLRITFLSYQSPYGRIPLFRECWWATCLSGFVPPSPPSLLQAIRNVHLYSLAWVCAWSPFSSKYLSILDLLPLVVPLSNGAWGLSILPWVGAPFPDPMFCSEPPLIKSRNKAVFFLVSPVYESRMMEVLDVSTISWNVLGFLNPDGIVYVKHCRWNMPLSCFPFRNHAKCEL